MLSACGNPAPNKTQQPTPPKSVDKADCQAKNGRIVYGKVGAVCSLPTADGGKVCTTNSDCEGLCLAGDSGGTCATHDANFGCIPVLENGNKVTLCID